MKLCSHDIIKAADYECYVQQAEWFPKEIPMPCSLEL
jgi:hypothetical protein